MRFYEYISKLVKKHPWMIIAVSLLLTVGLGMGLLSLKAEVTYQSLLPPGFPSVKAVESLRRNFGGISYETVLLQAPDVLDSRITEFLGLFDTYLNKDPRFNQGQIEYLKDKNGKRTLDPLGQPVPIVQDYLTPFIAIEKQQIAESSPVKDLSYATNANLKAFTGLDYEQTVRQRYLSVPQVRQQMVGQEKFLTADYKSAQVLLKVGANLTDTQQIKLAKDLEQLFTSHLKGVNGLKMSFSGDPTLARDFDRHIKDKTILLFLLSIAFVILTLFLAFRRTTDTLVPIGVMVMSLVWTFGIMGYLGIPYSVASVAIMPLLLGHALTFIVPFVARYYEEAENRKGSVAAVGRSIMTVGMALFPAAATSVVGFLVFEFSILPALRNFGVAAAIGTVFLFVLSLTLLPAIMVLRDRRMEQARSDEKRVQKQSHFDGFTRRQKQSLFARGTDRTLEWFGMLSTRHSLLVIIISTVLIVAGFAGSFGLTTDSDLRKLVPRDLPGIHADFQLEQAFGPQQTDTIMVTGDVLSPKSIAAMDRLENSIVADKANTSVLFDKALHKNVPQQEYMRDAIIGLPDVVIGANNGQLPKTRQEVLNALKVAADSGGYVGGVLSPDNTKALISLNGRAARIAKVVDSKMGILQGNSDVTLTPSGLKFELGGITPLTKDLTKNIIPTETWSSILSLLACGLLLVLIFKSVPYGLITLMVAVAGVAAEIGFLTIMHYPIDVVTSLASALVIGVGVNFGILFTHRYMQSVEQNGILPVEAIRDTMMNLGRANIVAAISTVAGFLIIMLSQIQPLKRFGGVTAFGIAWSLIASLTFMPALLHRLSRHRDAGKEREAPQASSEPETT